MKSGPQKVDEKSYLLATILLATILFWAISNSPEEPTVSEAKSDGILKAEASAKAGVDEDSPEEPADPEEKSDGDLEAEETAEADSPEEETDADGWNKGNSRRRGEVRGNKGCFESTPRSNTNLDYMRHTCEDDCRI